MLKIAAASHALLATIFFALALPLPALAGEARASGNVPVRRGPGSGYAIIGDGASYEVETCTLKARWCLLSRNGDTIGWTGGSYLIGSTAKAEATPFEFLFDLDFVPRM